MRAPESRRNRPKLAERRSQGADVSKRAAIRPGSQAPTRRSLGLQLALLVLLVFGAFSPTLFNGFVNFDDPRYVTANPYVTRGLSFPGLAWALKTTDMGSWHPVTWVSHMLQCQLFGVAASGHHLTSVLFHCGNTILLFLLLTKLTGAAGKSFCAAALFGLHPLRVESVAWVAEQKDLLSALFGLLAIWAYTRYVRSTDAREELARTGKSASLGHSRMAYVLSLAFFTLSLMSKPMLVTLPFLLLLMDYWPLQRLAGTSERRASVAKVLAEKLPFLALAAACSVVTVLAQKHEGAVASLSGTPLPARMANAVVAYARYVGKFFWPADLAVFYPYPSYLSLTAIALSVVVLVLVSALVLVWRKRAPYLPVGWFWFLGALVPVIGFIQAGAQSMADRYSYFPSIGLIVAVVWGAAALLQLWNCEKTVAPILVSLPLLILGLLTVRQSRYWHDSGSLFRHALAVTGDNGTAYWHLGDYAYLEQGRLPEAAQYYRAALKSDPSMPDVHLQLGNVLYQQGSPQEAVREFEEAIRLRPGWARPHNNLGFVLEHTGQLDRARNELEEAARLDPDSAEAQGNLGRVLFRQGHLDEGIQHLQRAVALNGGVAELYDTLGAALCAQGKLTEGISALETAVKLDPSSVDARLRLAAALLKAGQRDQAIQQLKLVLKLQPNNQPAKQELEILSGGEKQP